MSGLAVVLVAVPAAGALVWGLSWIACGTGSLAYRLDEWRHRR